MLYGPTVSMVYDFHSPFFDLIFIKKNWIEKDSIFDKGLIFDTWIFWNWYLKFWDFETLRFWFEIWKLKSKILRFRILEN